MALEIERKFLVRGDAWRSLVKDVEIIRQGYLNEAKDCSIRIRVVGDQAWLNIKSATVGAQRHEYEYAIPLADAEEMLATLARRPLIEKVRHHVEHDGQVFEIDEFLGDNAGLVVAEVELDHPDQPFPRPDWLGEEVTHDIRYYNTCLAQRPYNTWPRSSSE